MANRLTVMILLSLPFWAALMTGDLNGVFSTGKTDISINISNAHLKVTAIYPRAKAKQVHEYFRNYLSLTDLPNMGSVAINHYETPDKSMSFAIKSRDGYIRITMDRRENSTAAFDKLRGSVEGLKAVLADK